MRNAGIVVLVVLIVAAAWVGKQAYTVYSGLSHITGQKVVRPTNEPTVTIPSFGDNKRVNFLLLGSDNDQKKEEAAPLTQSMIVVTVDPVHHTVGLLSIPRDFWVKIPGHGQAKIDLAFKYGYQHGYAGAKRGMEGGVALARDTVERLFHIQIDYYGWVGLQGFSKVIDTFGGVTPDVQHPVLDDTYPNDIHSPDPYGQRRLFIPAGWQHMEGNAALEYVRSRHGDIHGDFGRSSRQQQVLLQLRQKINATNIITRLPDLVNDLVNSVQTDLTLQQVYQLDQLSHQIPKQNITRLVLQAPEYCNYGTSSDGQSILVPYWNKILPQVRKLFAPIAFRPPRPAATSSAYRATVSATPRAFATSGPSPTPQPTVTPTPVPPSVKRLPGTLLYVSGNDIYSLSAEGNATQITYSHDAGMPELSPNGRTLAFVRFTNGLHRFDKYASDIWLMDLATRRQHVLTQDESSVPANNLWAVWPTWSADGKGIVFSTDRAKLPYPPSDARAIDLAVWSMPAAGGQTVQLTTPQIGAGGDTDPVWRPRTNQFLYVQWAYASESASTPYSDLVLEDASTKASVTLTPKSGRVLQPSWGPGGHQLAYIRSAGGQDQLVVAQVSGAGTAGKVSREQVVATGKLAQPSFTPDGKWISFLRGDGDSFDLYLVRPWGSQLRRVDGVNGAIDARWRPVWGR